MKCQRPGLINYNGIFSHGKRYFSSSFWGKNGVTLTFLGKYYRIRGANDNFLHFSRFVEYDTLRKILENMYVKKNKEESANEKEIRKTNWKNG